MSMKDINTIIKALGFCMLCIFTLNPSGKTQDTSDSSYFSMDSPDEYPPYDSSEWRNSRATLIGGHLAHNLFFHSAQAQLLQNSYDLNLPKNANIVAGFLATTPAIVNTLRGNISPEGYWMKHHGTKMGFYYGFMTSIASNNNYLQFNRSESERIATFSSIGLGMLGYYIGSRPGWDDNRVSLFKHYGTLGANIGLAAPLVVKGSTNWETSITSSLLGAAGGYYYASIRDKVTDKTRGDYVTTDLFTVYNAYYWYRGLVTAGDISQSNALNPRLVGLPILATVGSSFLNQYWVRNARLSRNQAKKLGGILVGVPALHALVFNRQNTDQQGVFSSLITTYLAGGAVYKLALDQVIGNNQDKRNADSVSSRLSIRPVSSTLPADESFRGGYDKDAIFNPGIQVKLQF